MDANSKLKRDPTRYHEPDEAPNSRARDLQAAAVGYLLDLSEDEVCRTILIPFFTKRGFRVEHVDRRLEGEHGLDLRLIGQNGYLVGVVAKSVLFSDQASVYNSRAEGQIHRAFGYPHSLTGAEEVHVHRLYVINSKPIDITAEHHLLRLRRQYNGRLDFWGVETLAKEISDHAPELIPELKALDLSRRASASGTKQLWVSAALLLSELARWYLGRGKIDAARSVIAEATDCLGFETRPQRYFIRTLRAFLTCLSECDVAPGPASDQHSIQAPSTWPATRLRFWLDVTFLLEQIDILRTQTTVGGLTGMRTCLLLQRVGVSAENALIDGQLRWIAAEMAREDGISLDRRCSLCTAAAVSCLALAGDIAKAAAPIDWLLSLKAQCFHCRGSLDNASDDRSGDEQAFHYTAAVFQGFCDAAGSDSDAAATVRECLLGTAPDPQCFKTWMNYRDQAELDVCSDILPDLLRFTATGGRMLPHQKENLTQAVGEFAKIVSREAGSVRHPPAYYPARENLAGLALANVLGVDSLFEPVIDHLRARIPHIRRARRLLDSDLGRSTRICDSWLLYWESKLVGGSF